MSTITPQIWAAAVAGVHWHEVRNSAKIAYRLSYAVIGASGGSFGFDQEDCHANPEALATLHEILLGAKMPATQIGRILGVLHEAQRSNPLSVVDLAAVDAAINSTQGRAKVDAADVKTETVVRAQVDRCIDAAAEIGCTILPAALVGMALWINQAGAPTMLLRWLRGLQAVLGGKIVAPLQHGAAIGEAEFLTYYRMIPFVRENSGQEPAFIQAMREGCRVLPSGTTTGLSAAD